MHSDDELEWIVRLYEKIEDVEIQMTFFLLLSELYKNPKLEIQPAPREPFTEVKLRFLGRNYFAFMSAKCWLHWTFKKVAFDYNIVEYDEVLQLYPEEEKKDNGEISVNIKGTKEARKMLGFLGQVIDRNS